MKRVWNERFQEAYIEETLENGLHVVLWEKKGFKKSFFMMATPMGALDLNQVDQTGEEISFPAGIAHFLEHKMFEDGTQDVMDTFAQMGANVNAFTSYSETAYYFSTTNDPMQPLNLLLDFVQELKISEESVEKEKGIIIQELEMYQQMSEMRIINETFSSLFEQHPLKYDIGGDSESVSATTKEQLEQCYSLNYHPSKMVLIGVTGEDPKKVLQVIRENQCKKKFDKGASIQRKVYHEKDHVYKQKHSITMDINVPKVNVAFKLKGIQDANERNKKEWCYKILFDMYFTSLNPSYQDWLDDEIINPSFSFDIDLGVDYGIIMFYSETEKTDAFKEIIVSLLASIHTIDDVLLKHLKNRYFGLSINALNDHRQIAISFMRNYFEGLDFFNTIDMIETIEKDDLLQALAEIELDNYSDVQILPK